jgi:glucan phosphoethanolaminetransferase (alkaline phosphatase superfamily)
MRLFDATSTYVYIFCAYALNALVLLLHTTKNPTSTLRSPDFLVLIPMIVGMVFGALLSFVSIRKTSSRIEKTVLILTGALCVLFLIGVLPKVGYEWANFPFSHAIFVIVSCIAAVLTGIRVFQLVRFSKENSALS